MRVAHACGACVQCSTATVMAENCGHRISLLTGCHWNAKVNQETLPWFLLYFVCVQFVYRSRWVSKPALPKWRHMHWWRQHLFLRVCYRMAWQQLWNRYKNCCFEFQRYFVEVFHWSIKLWVFTDRYLVTQEGSNWQRMHFPPTFFIPTFKKSVIVF